MIFAGMSGSEHARNDAARSRVCSCPSYGAQTRRCLRHLWIKKTPISSNATQTRRKRSSKGDIPDIERNHHDKSSPVPTPASRSFQESISSSLTRSSHISSSASVRPQEAILRPSFTHSPIRRHDHSLETDQTLQSAETGSQRQGKRENFWKATRQVFRLVSAPAKLRRISV